jgi:hypothetical protein
MTIQKNNFLKVIIVFKFGSGDDVMAMKRHIKPVDVTPFSEWLFRRLKS